MLSLLQNEVVSGAFNTLIRSSLILSFFAFFGLYLLVPNKKIHFSHAAAGSLVAALLFNLVRKASLLTLLSSLHIR